MSNNNKTVYDIAACNIVNLDACDELSTIIKTTAPSPEEFDTLLNIEYDNGYGGQEIDGTILFNDNTWLSRGEYDGSEWWQYNKCPTIEEVIN